MFHSETIVFLFAGYLMSFLHLFHDRGISRRRNDVKTRAKQRISVSESSERDENDTWYRRTKKKTRNRLLNQNCINQYLVICSIITYIFLHNIYNVMLISNAQEKLQKYLLYSKIKQYLL